VFVQVSVAFDCPLHCEYDSDYVPCEIGMLYTPMMYGNGMSSELRESRKERSILKTEGNAWDCASAVRFLAGDEARWITGSILTVDAGATAALPIPQ
jgi:NAD(P)-dependent dehydrogenase (short-subunit alcohol dehydrogenase family)